MHMGMPLEGRTTTPLDTREYCVEFDGREVSKMAANVISDSMYASCDDSGNEYLMMDSIVDYRKSDKSTSISNKKVVHRGQSFMCRSTVGFHICVQWRYGSTSWKALKDMK